MLAAVVDSIGSMSAPVAASLASRGYDFVSVLSMGGQPPYRRQD